MKQRLCEYNSCMHKIFAKLMSKRIQFVMKKLNQISYREETIQTKNSFDFHWCILFDVI